MRIVCLGDSSTQGFGVEEQAVSYTHLDVYKRQVKKYALSFYKKECMVKKAEND